MKKYVTISILCLVVFSCGNSEKRSEIEIAIRKAAEAAAEKNVDEFMTFIGYDYLDSGERSRQDIRGKIEAYFNRFRGISLNILNIKTVKKNDENAEVIMEINFSHGLGKMLSKMIRSYGESYRFDLIMSRRNNRWVVSSAEWEWMSIEDLYPESIKVLRELFPGTF